MIRSLAYLDDRRQLCVIDAAGRPGLRLRDLPWAAWDGAPEEEVHSWPTWSPDGSRVASFRMAPRAPSGMTIVVQITERAGARVLEVGEIVDRLPIYLQWTPRGDALAVLTQAGDQLHLDRFGTRPDGAVQPLVEASPLFFDQTPDGRIAVFAGEGPRPPRMSVLASHGRVELPGMPGNFCAPVILGQDVAYVVVDDAIPELRIASLDGSSSRDLGPIDGLAALLPSPDRSELALSIAHDGTGETYHGLWTVDVATGARHKVTDLPLTAFFWLPEGEGWLIAQRTRVGTIQWSIVERRGRVFPIAELLATRDLRFYLRFFEQFALSHPLVDAEGTTLTLAGGLVGEQDPRGTPRVWVMPVRGGPAEAIAEGVFGTFAPRVTR